MTVLVRHVPRTHACRRPRARRVGAGFPRGLRDQPVQRYHQDDGSSIRYTEDNNYAAGDDDSIEVRPVQRVPETTDPENVLDESVDTPRSKGLHRVGQVLAEEHEHEQPEPTRVADGGQDRSHRSRRHRRQSHAASAVSEVPGAGMLLAGNSGKKRLSAADQDAGTNHLLGVGALGKPQPLKSGRRSPDQRWDQTSIRALLTGDYRRAHPDHAEELERIAAAVEQGPRWEHEPEDDWHASVHGEMTLAGKQIEHWHQNPWPLGEGKIKEVAMGGVKKACGACQWTFDAVNKHIGRRLGYKLVASGSHGRLYAGWKLPVWLDGEAREEVKAKADGVGWWSWRDDDALDRTDTNAQEPGGNPQEPVGSDSEWEEIDSEGNEMASSWETSGSGGGDSPQTAGVRPKRQRDDEIEAEEADPDARAKRRRPDGNHLRGTARP